MTATNSLLFVEGEWVEGERTEPLVEKFGGATVALVHQASVAQVNAALEALTSAQDRIRLTPYRRFEILAEASRLLSARHDEAVTAIVRDTGFTVTDARREVDRAVDTLLISGEEAKRIHGEMVPIDAAPAGPRRIGFTTLRPLGVVCAITPFNSPLNTVAHKVAPALAAGNAVILKPASQTPLSASLLVETLLKAGLPPELVALVQGPGASVGEALLNSPVPAFYAFTGSNSVGEHIQRAVGVRRIQLELGSVSSTIVCDDADLARLAPLVINAAFRKAGQVCTSIQRLYVHGSVIAEMSERLLRELSNREVGDPWSERTFVGPVISEQAATRICSRIDDAVRDGAEILVGGARSGNVVQPTVLSGVQPEMDVMAKEIFGPVIALRSFAELDTAIAEVNNTEYGLSAGIFTASIERAMDAASGLRMGSIHINETSSNRVDLMPYGGAKASGLGLEGPRYAIEEMSQKCLITIGRP
jgi:succinate-semialdehyde dehydrogenase/glutarate-semialdehyde dehydrogenase